MTLIRVDGKRITPQFMFHVLNSDYVQHQVKQLWTQGTQPNISMGEVENIFVVAPSVEEQEKIVVYLDKEIKRLDDLKARVGTAIERLREYRAALVSSAVTGKIQVKDEG
jgi:type I restriction enzyme, S subunit